MIKTFKYIYKDAAGNETTLKKAITDRMEPDDKQKKVFAAGYFAEMLRHCYGEPLPVIARNIQEV